MNPCQRRGVLLMIVAAIGALAVAFTVISYVGTLRAEIGSYRTVLRLTQDVPAYAPVTEDLVEETQVPAKFFEENFVGDLATDLELEPGTVPVAAAPLNEGSLLQSTMLTTAPDLDSGEREIAIMVDTETGVAGKVGPGSMVDVYATFDELDSEPQCAVRVLTAVEIIEVGIPTTSSSEGDGEEGGGPAAFAGSSVPITFGLNTDETLKLTQVEAFASTIRLGMVSAEGGGNPGDSYMCNADILEDLGIGQDEEGGEQQPQDGQ